MPGQDAGPSEDAAPAEEEGGDPTTAENEATSVPLAAIRRYLAPLPVAGRPQWNRLMLFLWPPVYIPREEIDAVAAREAKELDRRVHRYREGRPPLDVRDRTVVLVDDGIATGATVRAALRWLAAHEPRRVILATPVAAAETVEELRPQVDEVVALYRACDEVEFGRPDPDAADVLAEWDATGFLLADDARVAVEPAGDAGGALMRDDLRRVSPRAPTSPGSSPTPSAIRPDSPVDNSAVNSLMQ